MNNKWVCSVFHLSSFKIIKCFIFEGTEQEVEIHMNSISDGENAWMYESLDEAIVEYFNNLEKTNVLKEYLL